MTVSFETKYYDARQLASNIARKYSGIRHSAKYEAAQDRLFDYTSACDKGEQVRWMQFYMAQALKMEMQATKERNNEARYDAAVQFIAAYDMI